MYAALIRIPTNSPQKFVMTEINSFVQYRNYCIWASGKDAPCLLNIDVSARYSTITSIVIQISLRAINIHWIVMKLKVNMFLGKNNIGQLA